MKNYTSPALTVIDITNMEGVFACTNPYSNGWNSGSYYSGGSAQKEIGNGAGNDTDCYNPLPKCPIDDESDDDGCKPRKPWPWGRWY